MKKYFHDLPETDAPIDPSEFFNDMFKPFRYENHPKPPCIDVHLTEILSPDDPRTALFNDAKQKEIKGLIDRGTWKLICKDEVLDNANILGGRFVLAIKDAGADKEIWKARFVVQGFRDKLKEFLVHDTSTARQHSTRVLVGLASISALDCSQQMLLKLLCKARRNF